MTFCPLEMIEAGLSDSEGYIWDSSIPQECYLCLAAVSEMMLIDSTIENYEIPEWAKDTDDEQLSDGFTDEGIKFVDTHKRSLVRITGKENPSASLWYELQKETREFLCKLALGIDEC